MNTESRQVLVGGLHVHVVRKAIKNLHLGVYPPNGRVRVAVPLAVSDSAVRLAVVRNLGWIKRQRAKFDAQARQSKREMLGGETHYLFGRSYRLHVVPCAGGPKVVVPGRSVIELHVPPDASADERERALQRWYRAELKARIPALLDKWQRKLDVTVTAWGVRRMKTKWGTCNRDTGRILLNLELAKKSMRCLEYLVVHELVHLIERRHSERFASIMDTHLPRWRLLRAELNAAPLAHENWSY